MSRFAIFAAYLAYMTFAATLVPLPTEPPPIYLGQFYPPLVVAFWGALGDVLATLIEYGVFHGLFRRGKLKWLQKSSKVAWVKKKMKNHLIWGAFVANATGLFPSDAVRVVAILNRENRALFCLAVFAGRLPRYYLLAKMGAFLVVPLPLIAALFTVLLLWALYHRQREKRLMGA